MKATGIVRRVDDLGRIVIPKEIRRTLRIREGDPLEIYTEKDGGGSYLTEEGKEWLQRYETYRDACKEANRNLYLEFFPEKR